MTFGKVTTWVSLGFTGFSLLILMVSLGSIGKRGCAVVPMWMFATFLCGLAFAIGLISFFQLRDQVKPPLWRKMSWLPLLIACVLMTTLFILRVSVLTPYA